MQKIMNFKLGQKKVKFTYTNIHFQKDLFWSQPTDKQKEPLNYYLKYLKIITVSENSGKVLNLYYPCPSPSTDTQTHRHTDAQTPLQYRLPLLGFSLFFFLPFLLFLQTQILHRFSVLLV